jgi:putative phosphoesterase
VVRLALISDIHGNCVALDAVLADLPGRAVEEVVCLGDVAAGGPQPHEVIARLRGLGCRVVRGNADGWLLAGLPPGRSNERRRLSEVVAWARDRLATEERDYLAALPATLRIAAGGLDLFCFHGSPRFDTDSLLPTTPAVELDRLLADAPAARVFAAGHTHLQMLRAHRAAVLVNPGSVGLPWVRCRRATRRCRPGPSFSDARLSDLIGISQYGVVYTGKKKKIAEHGGDNPQDRDVALVVSGNPISDTGDVVSTPVETTQIAPTILQLLGLNPNALRAVQLQHTQTLPIG